MTPQIFLIAPMTADTNDFPEQLATMLDAASVSALLLPRGERSDEEYAAFAKVTLPVAQARGCAVLIDNEPLLAKKIGADGVHMSTGIKAFSEAMAMLKPDMIVGAGNIHSRHDAMTKGEAGADYVLFGTLTGPADPETVTEAAWWAETFEVPAVYCNPAADPAAPETAGCEFIGLSDSVWNAPGGAAAALARVAKAIGAQ